MFIVQGSNNNLDENDILLINLCPDQTGQVKLRHVLNLSFLSVLLGKIHGCRARFIITKFSIHCGKETPYFFVCLFVFVFFFLLL